jgi:hypothetical protein
MCIVFLQLDTSILKPTPIETMKGSLLIPADATGFSSHVPGTKSTMADTVLQGATLSHFVIRKVVSNLLRINIRINNIRKGRAIGCYFVEVVIDDGVDDGVAACFVLTGVHLLLLVMKVIRKIKFSPEGRK